MNDRVLTQGQVENEIRRALHALEDQTDQFATVSELAANAEADYKHAYASAMLHAAAVATERVAAAKLEAVATVDTVEQLRHYKIMDASKTATKEALLSLRARLDALRSLTANIRGQT